MSRKQSTGELRFWFVPSVANVAAPTVSEINAGVDLTGYLKRDGLDTPKDGNTANAADVSSPYNKQSPGTFGGNPITLNLYRDSSSGADTAWTTLVPPKGSAPDGTPGFLVIRRFGGSAVAAAAGQRVEVWPVAVNSRMMDKIAENENQSFTASLAVPAEPNDDAVIT